jgi:hypothetical protein
LNDDTRLGWFKLFGQRAIDVTTSFNLRKSAELLSATQEDLLKAFVGGTLPRSTRQIGTWIEKEFGAPRIELRAMCLMVVKLAGA